MKKILFAAVAVMAMAACSNEDVISRPALPVIGFDTFVENSTRAADINADNLANFGVYGSVVNSQNQQGMIFANQMVTKTALGYEYSPEQYWIAGAKYDFVAFAPYQSGADATWTYAPKVATDATVATAAENGTITFDNAKADANQDLLFAATACTTPANITTAPEAVKFTFNHLLSRVRFTFTNGFQMGSNIELKVENVKITNVDKVGTLGIANRVAGDWSVDETKGVFEKTFGNAGTDDYIPVADNAANSSASTEHFYLIPANGTYNVTFVVKLKQAGVELATYPRTATVPLNMVKGYSYNVKAILDASNTSNEGQLYPIEFQVEGVSDWANYTNADATVTLPTTGGNQGTENN
ncbi:MAG: fimbrillin family protein [Alistipes sp.]|nr:fimbrillin family protein [Alistipes sp.]